MRIFKNLPHKLELAIIDTNGNYVTGLNVTYVIIKCSDGSVVDSGSMDEINSIYTKEYTFTVLGEYRVKYTTPTGYENGFETIIVDEYDNFKADVSLIKAKTDQLTFTVAGRVDATASGGGGGLTPEEHDQVMMIEGTSDKILEIYELYGLDPTKPLIVTPTIRQAGTIVQRITTKTKETKVQRQ